MNTLTVKEIKEELPPFLTENDVIAMDLELSGLLENQLHRPHGRMTSLAGCFDGETVYLIYEEGDVEEYLKRVEKATWVFHNSIFDLGHLKRWSQVKERKNMRDTMIIEKLLYSNYYDDFGLQALVRRHLGCYMSKDVRKEFSSLEGRMTKE